MKEDLKNFAKLMAILFLPFIFIPLAASCQEQETKQRKAECFEQGGKPIINHRNVVTGCVLGE